MQFAVPPRPEELEKIEALAEGQHRRRIDLPGIRGMLYTLPAHAIGSLADNPNVVYISPDRPLHATLDNVDPTVGAQTAWSWGLDGTGVGVAIIDSGIHVPQPDLATSQNQNASYYQFGNGSRVIFSQNFVPNSNDPSDTYGHGTHVAGIVAGSGANSTGSQYFKTFRGIAPNANLINLRVLDNNGAGTDSAVINAINAAIWLKDFFNIRIINLSLGRPVYESYKLDPLCQAVEKAWKAGIVVVVAAGNGGRDNSQGTDGYATITAPGNDPFVITVGAMKTMGTPFRSDDLIASYSSKGPTLIDHVVKPDIVAPGNRTISIEASKSLVATSSGAVNGVPYNYYEYNQNSTLSTSYYKLSGTSMAAPVVAGTAALMLQRNPSLSPDTIKARLMKTATKSFPAYSVAVDPVTGIKYTSQYDMFTIGAGYIDVVGALNSSDTVPYDSSALSPTAVFSTTANKVSLTNSNTPNGTAAVWGSGVFGAAAVWGSSVFVSGAAAVWGSDTSLWGTAAVWGSSSLSGNCAVWGSAAVWGSSTNDNGEDLSLLVNGEN